MAWAPKAPARSKAVGPGVKTLKVGDRVAYASGPLGAYSGAYVLNADSVVKLPAGIGYEQAAGDDAQGSDGAIPVFDRRTGCGYETILFHAAAGGVGLIACQWARALGVKLIGTVSSPEKAQLARGHGAWATIDYTKEDVVARVLELTGGAKVPVVYDSVGRNLGEVARLACNRAA